jgi:hypothetical protein
MSTDCFPIDARNLEYLLQVTAASLQLEDENMRAQRAYHSQTVVPSASRRRAPRAGVGSDVLIQVDGADVLAVDVSLGGLQICSHTRIPLGRTVMTSLRWRGEDKATIALARVVWTMTEEPHRLSSPQFRLGAAFETADFRMIRAILSRCGLVGR